MLLLNPGLLSGPVEQWYQDEASRNEAVAPLTWQEAADSGVDVVVVQQLFGFTFVGRGRVHASSRDAIESLANRLKREKPLAPKDTHMRAEAIDVCRFFYSLPGRERPGTKSEQEHVIGEVRLVLAKDMEDTRNKADRVERLKRLLEAATNDAFWAKQIISLGGLRKKGQNGRMKWKNAEAGLQGHGGMGVYVEPNNDALQRYK